MKIEKHEDLLTYIESEAERLEKKQAKLLQIVNNPQFIELCEPEFLEVIKPLIFGIKKHGKLNWLEIDGKGISHYSNHRSMQRHLTASYLAGADPRNPARLDPEQKLDHLLAVAVRALMAYTRLKRSLYHPDDIMGVNEPFTKKTLIYEIEAYRDENR